MINDQWLSTDIHTYIYVYSVNGGYLYNGEIIYSELKQQFTQATMIFPALASWVFTSTQQDIALFDWE